MIVLNYIIRSLLIVLLLIGTMGHKPYQSYCQQNFKFLFHAKDSNSFWIGLNLYGDQCELSKVIQISIAADGMKIKEHIMNRFDEWEDVEPFRQKSEIDYVVELTNNNRVWEYPVADLKVKKPSYNAKLMNFYLEELNSVCGKAWNNAMGVNGVTLPKLTTSKTPHLIYSHPTGLYFNYEISKAYYFPDTQYLLIFTAQPTRCTGGGSMHGFMLFSFQ